MAKEFACVLQESGIRGAAGPTPRLYAFQAYTLTRHFGQQIFEVDLGLQYCSNILELTGDVICRLQ